jgi:hypothetical protein
MSEKKPIRQNIQLTHLVAATCTISCMVQTLDVHMRGMNKRQVMLSTAFGTGIVGSDSGGGY